MPLGAGRMGADRIEVAQADDAPGRIGPAEVGEDLLDLQLRAAVGVGGGARRVGLVQGERLRRAVDRRGRAEDEALHARGAHRLQEPQRAHDVVVVVFERLDDRFAHGLEPCEMDDGLDFLLTEHAFERSLVADVALDEFRRPSGDRPDALGDAAVGVREIVEEHRFMTGLLEYDGSMRADEAHSAREEHAHVLSLLGILEESFGAARSEGGSRFLPHSPRFACPVQIWGAGASPS